MSGIEIQILPLSKIRWSEPSNLQAWRSIPLKISDQVALEYPDHFWLLPSCKCVEHTLELTSLPVQQHPGPSCWGSFCRCETCPHDIWCSWYTPQHSTGLLNLPVAFLVASSVTPMSTAAVYQLVFLVAVREGKDERFRSIQGDIFSDPWISPPDDINPIGACSPGF